MPGGSGYGSGPGRGRSRRRVQVARSLVEAKVSILRAWRSVAFAPRSQLRGPPWLQHQMRRGHLVAVAREATGNLPSPAASR